MIKNKVKSQFNLFLKSIQLLQEESFKLKMVQSNNAKQIYIYTSKLYLKEMSNLKFNSKKNYISFNILS